MLLYTKCRIATAAPCGEARLQVLQSCCEALEFVKKNFSKVGAHVRLLQTWYLQVRFIFWYSIPVVILKVVENNIIILKIYVT